MRLPVTLFFCAALLSTAPAWAQQAPKRPQQPEYKAGLNYAAFPRPSALKPDAPETSEPATPEKPMRVFVPKAEKVTTAASPEEPTETQIWNKYKALASGTANTEEPASDQQDGKDMKTLNVAPDKELSPEELEQALKDAEDGSEKDTDPEQQNAQGTSALQALLRDWQANKDSQRDMHSRSFAVPAGLGSKSAKKAE